MVQKLRSTEHELIDSTGGVRATYESVAADEQNILPLHLHSDKRQNWLPILLHMTSSVENVGTLSDSWLVTISIIPFKTRGATCDFQCGECWDTHWFLASHDEHHSVHLLDTWWYTWLSAWRSVGQVAPHKKLTDNYWWNASGRLDKMGQLKNQLSCTWAHLLGRNWIF